MDGYYFITICSYKRDIILCEVVGEGLASSRKGAQLSMIGKIIDVRWNDIPNTHYERKQPTGGRKALPYIIGIWKYLLKYGKDHFMTM